MSQSASEGETLVRRWFEELFNEGELSAAAEIWAHWDTLKMAQELGVVPEVGAVAE